MALAVFTDASSSALSRVGQVGPGHSAAWVAVSLEDPTKNFQCGVRHISKIGLSNNAEPQAVLAAVEALPEEELFVFTDSLSTVQVVERLRQEPSYHPQGDMETYRKLAACPRLTLRHCPGHAGIFLNELADTLMRRLRTDGLEAALQKAEEGFYTGSLKTLPTGRREWDDPSNQHFLETMVRRDAPSSYQPPENLQELVRAHRRTVLEWQLGRRDEVRAARQAARAAAAAARAQA